MRPQLTILNIAYPLAPVGPDAVGGAEQVLTQLDAALTQQGDRSIVIACEGSTTQGILVQTPKPKPPLNESTRFEAWHAYSNAIAFAMQRWPIDLLHFHGVDCLEYLPPAGVPALITLHLPPQWYPPRIFRLERPQTWLHCVSASQRALCPPCASILPEIENGIAADFSNCRHRKRDFALTLGRICHEKGFHVALDAATRAEIPLLLGGEVFPYPAHEEYFRAQVLPRLDHKRRFLGPVGLKRKRRLLAAARCLVAPSLVSETSSLVAMEALACGTPVVAFPAGALSEIVEHGKTGFLVKDAKEMAEAMWSCDSLDPKTCRRTARERFDLHQTLEKYFKLYRCLAKNGYELTQASDLNRAAVTTRGAHDPRGTDFVTGIGVAAA